MIIFITTLLKLLVSSGVASLLLKRLFSLFLGDGKSDKQLSKEKIDKLLKEAIVDLASDLGHSVATARFGEVRAKNVEELAKKLTSKDKADVEMSDADIKEFAKKKLSAAYYYGIKKRTLNSIVLDPSLESSDTKLANKLFQ